jgi:hypothetical protein
MDPIVGPSGGLTPVRCDRPRCRDRSIPSWAYGLVQSSMRSAGTGRCWLVRFPCAVARFRARPWGLPIRPSRVDGLVSAHAPLFEFHHPSGSSTDTEPADARKRRHLPWAFRPAWHMQQPRSGHPERGQRPAPSVRRVWSPSRRLTPSTASSALFQTDSAFRVFPSEHVLSRG